MGIIDYIDRKMADEKQRSILRQGVETWNRWRKENENVRIDLRKADLKQANFAGANFTGAKSRKERRGRSF